MNTHHLHLHPEPFALVKSGKKTIESRLNDEKRQQYKVGDIIEFENRGNTEERLSVRIIALHHAASFSDLFSLPITRGKFSTDTIDELLRGVALYYSSQDQERYGVLGIEFQLISLV